MALRKHAPEPLIAPTATFMPAKFTLPALRNSAAHCRGCPLYLNATQTVFGEGAAQADIMLVGEQPGDQEDRTGHPFVGRSEEHTSELQSLRHLVCRLLLEKKKKKEIQQ